MFFLHKYLKKFVNLILFKVSNKFLYNYKIFDKIIFFNYTKLKL